MEEFIWAEKYRPRKVNDCILPDDVREKIADFVAKGEIPHLLFSGAAGTGKTTVAKAIADEIGADLLYINASNENNVDTIRTKVTQFASTVSLGGNLKIVLLDECLDANEKVRVGTVGDWKGVPLKDFVLGEQYPIVSVDMNTGEFFDDVGTIISDREDECFEIELEDGRKIVANAEHPFLCLEDGKIVQRKLSELTDTSSILA